MILLSYQVRRQVYQFAEMEDALNWLSTLGGAYSNLGEHSQVGNGIPVAMLVTTNYVKYSVAGLCCKGREKRSKTTKGGFKLRGFLYSY